MEFKVGDKVKMKEGCAPLKSGDICIVYIREGDLWASMGGDRDGASCDQPEKWELISSNKTTMVNLKEKFILGLTKEPQKSFRKAEVTDGDDILTEEGAKVFLTWLLHTVHADAFKKDVVDGILAEKEKE